MSDISKSIRMNNMKAFLYSLMAISIMAVYIASLMFICISPFGVGLGALPEWILYITVPAGIVAMATHKIVFEFVTKHI